MGLRLFDCDDAPAAASYGQDMIAQGYAGALFYLDANKAGRLTRDIAAHFGSMGLYCGSITEDWNRGAGCAPDNPAYFSNGQGVSLAHELLPYMQEIGQSYQSYINLAVDFDASEGQITGPIFDFFAGFRAINQDLYLLRPYGSGLVCRLLFEAGLTHDGGWLARPTGWAESASYAGWTIRQTENGAPLFGALSVDIDELADGVTPTQAGMWLSDPEQGG
jgi:Domain of unknown function (DUF1906)